MRWYLFCPSWEIWGKVFPHRVELIPSPLQLVHTQVIPTLWLNMNRYVLYSYLVWLSIKSVPSHKTWLSQWLLFMAPALCRINKNDSYEYESLSFILFVAIFVFPWSVFWSGSYWSIKPESEVSSKKYWDLWYRKRSKEQEKNNLFAGMGFLPGAKIGKIH